MSEERWNISGFFEMQRERYRMLLRKGGLLAPPPVVVGEPPQPLTNDPVLRRWRFCNVFREDDRTTKWFRENIRDPLRDKPEVLLATVAFRWFNRIETGEKIKDILLSGKWDGREVRKRLFLTQPVVTGAFMVKTPSGCDKLEGVCWCIEQFAKDADHLIAGLGHYGKGDITLEGFWSTMCDFPFMGGFMAYEVVTDLRHTYLLENAPDISTWANFGPGATRGMGRVIAGNPDEFGSTSEKDQATMLHHARMLLKLSQDPVHWPREWPQWEMREVEHGLCEFDKYCRGHAGEKLKRKYP